MVVALVAELEVWEVLDTHELSSPVVPCSHELRQGSVHYIIVWFDYIVANIVTVIPHRAHR